MVYTGNRSLICWQKFLKSFWFAWIRKKIHSDSEYGFRPCSDPCETRFVGTHQHVTGAELQSRIQNKINIFKQTIKISICKCWTMVAPLSEGSDVPGSNLGTVFKTHLLFFENWLVLKIASTFKTHVWLFHTTEFKLYLKFCLFPYTVVRLERGTPESQMFRSTH